MDVRVVLSSDEIIRGLNHYKSIAKQDIVRSSESDNPEFLRLHAEVRREVYAQLAEWAEQLSPAQVVQQALDEYQKLPFVSGTAADSHVDIKAKENALENFFLMIGLEPKARREARSNRPPLQNLPLAN